MQFLQEPKRVLKLLPGRLHLEQVTVEYYEEANIVCEAGCGAREFYNGPVSDVTRAMEERGWRSAGDLFVCGARCACIIRGEYVQ